MKTTTSKSGGFVEIRRSLLKLRKPQLINLIGELYRMSKENQRFLEARLGNPLKELPEYRKLVGDCLYPDVFGKNTNVRIIEAKRAISQYERAAGEPAGTVDLMLTFVEQGTAFANDVGYGEDSFFSALEGMLTRALALLQQSTQELRDSLESRLIRLAHSARHLGWGYGDFVTVAIGDALESDEADEQESDPH
jgi:hypothetical protein